MDELEPSPMKNVAGGAGCGCGCLGLLIAFAGACALAAGPMGLYVNPADAPLVLGVTALLVGATVFMLGAGIYLGSLFVD